MSRTADRASMMRALALVLAMLACLLAPRLADADVFRPAFLQLREVEGDRYEVQWRVPAQAESRRLALEVRFPDDVIELQPVHSVYTGNAVVEKRLIRRPGGLAGQTLYFEGRAADVSDVIIRIERPDGSSRTERLSGGRTQFVVPTEAGTAEIAWSYLVLGVGHILSGFDHLLFVLALLLIVHGWRRIVATVTAFTVAHSLTLAGATLGWVRVPGPPVEACIALSIVFVAGEAVQGLRGRPGLTARAPWIVAFAFGLLHGFGFAGALAEVGLPTQAIPLALLMFNVGVELGQLIFVAVALAVMALLGRLAPRLPAWTALAVPYGIGTLAMFWVIDRVGAFWS